MTPIVVVSAAAEMEPDLRVRDELRDNGLPCALLVESDGAAADPDAAAAACGALAAAGISSVVHAGPVRAPALVAALERAVPHVVPAGPSAAATLDDCRARGWLPEPGEVYTPEELDAVTSRLQELGYA
jgi:hypothetical protein